MKQSILFFGILLVFSASFSQHRVDTSFTILIEDLSKVMVKTASLKSESSDEAPAMIYVFTQEQIEHKGYFYLNELLHDVPEIEIQQKSSAEYSNIISLRGIAGNEKFIIMRDGIRINAHSGSTSAVKENYSLHNVKRVEIILGPVSSLYGVDAFTGIVNMISRKGSELQGGKFTSSYGMYNTGHHAGAWGMTKKDISISLDGSFFHSSEAFYPKYYEEDYSWYNDVYSQNGGMSFLSGDTNYYDIKEYSTPTYAYTINARINIKSFEIGYNQNMENHNNSVGMNPRYSVYAKKNQHKTTLHTTYLKHTFSSPSKKLSIVSTLINNNYRLHPSTVFNNIFSNYNDAYKYANDNSFLWNEQVEYKINTKNHILLGGSFQNIQSLPNTGDLPQAFDPRQAPNDQNLYYLGTNITDSLGNDLSIAQDFYSIHYQNVGGYLQLQSKITPSISTTLGIRFDYNTRYGSTRNPRIAIVYQVIPKKLIWKFLYGSAFLAPSPYKAYRHYGAFVPDNSQPSQFTAFFWHLPNQDLKPETLNNLEMNIIYHHSKNLSIKTDVYWLHINNLITNQLFFDEEFKNTTVQVVERPTNQGFSRSYGGSIQINHQHKIAHHLFTTFLAYSYIDGTINGQPLSFSAKNTVKLGIFYQHKKLTITPKVLIRSASTHDLLTTENGDLLQNEGFYLINLYASYQLKSVFRTLTPLLFIKIDNLTNNKYYHLTYGSFESLGRAPQEPIRISGGFTLKF